MLPKPTVFVVDDDADLRDTLSWLLQSVDLAGETYATAEEFLSTYDPSRPGCLVLDIRLPGIDGLKLLADLGVHHVTLPVIVISGCAEVATAVRAMRYGAIDFIVKPFSSDLLLDRIHQAIASDCRTREARLQQVAIAARFARLSRREREVMELLAAGRINKAIASELGLSTKTVEVHRANVMAKMEADSVAELVRLRFSLRDLGDAS